MAIAEVLFLTGILCFGLYFLKRLAALEKTLPDQRDIALNGLFETASNIIAKTAAASVGKLEQLIGKDLRELIKAGRANKEELFMLAEDAYCEIVETVAPEVMDDLKKCVGNAELYIRNVIETELLKLKSSLSNKGADENGNSGILENNT